MIVTLYDQLLKSYGPRGWWPISLCFPSPLQGYHPADFSFPHNDQQRLEIALGAILTQNTAWTNVVKALQQLAQRGLFGLQALQAAPAQEIAQAITPAGYFNQKATYLKAFAAFLQSHPFARLQAMPLPQARKALLGVKGIGPETADCILLYALGHPVFVVDAYTRRFLAGLGWLAPQAGYAQVQELFHQGLTPNLNQYQEYHALLVEHGKRHYSKTPHGQNDPLRQALLAAGQGGKRLL